MKRFSFLLLIACSMSRGFSAFAAQEVNYQPLQADLRRFVEQERFQAAMWGIKVVSLENGRTVFEHNADRLLKPASNAKLYTGALALHRLGPAYRIKTSLYSNGGVTAGVLQGDLRIFGRGDPSFAARFHQGNYSQSLTALVASVREAGIKTIRGDLVCDESFFQGAPFGSGWAWDDLQYYYGAPVSALSAEDNVVDLIIHAGAKKGDPCRIEAHPTPYTLNFSNRTSTISSNGGRSITVSRALDENIVFVTGQLPLGGRPETDAVTVPEATTFFGALFREALLAEGISVTGGIRTVGSSSASGRRPNGVELASTLSPPMSELVAKMMKPSQNLYAQLLFLQVGAHRGELPGGRTTERAALRELDKFMGEIGIAERAVLLEEGSGLSRSALVTPSATVALLQYMDKHAAAEAFRESLPVAGVDGTLRRRFVGTAAAGKLRAKTGTLRYVNTLSGYATTAAGERLAFCIMLNNYVAPPTRPDSQGEVDAVALRLVQFK